MTRIAASPEFVQSERMRSFLTFIIEETLDGRADRLKGYTLGIEVFGREPDFDPSIDCIVRVEAGRLRSRLKTYYLEHAQGDLVFIELPKGGYVPQWSILKQSEPAADPSVRPLAPMTIEDDHDPVLDLPRGPSIVVLPFDNLSSDPEQALFADAIVENITTELARFRELFVIARTTAFQYKDQAIDVRRIGHDLGVRYLIEGSVQKSASLLRVTAQLIETASGAHLWADTYERDVSVQSLFEIQDDIAQQVAATVAQPFGALGQASLTAARLRPTDNWDAYQCYLHFWAYVHAIGPDTHLKARQKLEEAIQTDPACADALAALGYLALEEYRLNFNPLPNQGDPLDRAQALAHQAYERDNTCILALLTLSAVNYHRCQPDRCREFGERGLKLNPNNTEFLCDYGFHLGLIGDWDRSLALIEKAMALHPRFNTFYYFTFALHAIVEGRDEQALAYAKRVEKPKLYWDPLFRAAILGLLGRTAEAKDAVVELEHLYPDVRASLNDEFAKWPMNEHVFTRLAEGLGKAGLMAADG